MNNTHIPILLDCITEKLTEKYPNQDPLWIHVDCTLGGAGHFHGILKALKEKNASQPFLLIGIDQDPEVTDRARQIYKEEIRSGVVHIVSSRFSNLPEVLKNLNIEKMDSVLADLGFSSIQIDNPKRGLSFKSDGPLDMRLNPSHGVPFTEWILQFSEEEIGTMIRELGEERYWKRIAQNLFRAFHSPNPPKSPSELSELIVRSLPRAARFGQKIHPATRTFQAFRIAINQELEELDQLLENINGHIKTGGRVAIISFHSLEDRKVKRFFKDRSKDYIRLSKKPIMPDDHERKANPRSRSAKLRILERK